MSEDWLPESEVLKFFPKANAKLLRIVWRGGRSKAIRRLLGRDIRFREVEGGLFEYWRSHILAIAEALKPWGEFTQGKKTWLPDHLVKAQYEEQYRNLDSWHRLGCPFFPDSDNKRPKRKQFLTWGDGKVGLSYRWYYLQRDLELIDECLYPNTPPAGQAPDKVTVAEASKDRDLRASRSRIYRLLKAGTDIGQDKEVRLSERKRNGEAHKFPFNRRTVSRSKLKEAVREQIPDDDREIVPPSEAVALLEAVAKEYAREGQALKVWSIATMANWEEKPKEAVERGEKEHPCPFLGRPLKVVRKDALSTFQRGGRTVEAVLKDQKHYVRDEIITAFRVYAKQRPGVRVHQGEEWYTSPAAHREHGANQQALDTWNKRGWLDAVDLPRYGYGKGDKVRHFRASGDCGFLHLQSLQDPAQRNRIPREVANRLDAAAKEREKTEPQTGQVTTAAVATATESNKQGIGQPGQLTEALRLPDPAADGLSSDAPKEQVANEKQAADGPKPEPPRATSHGRPDQNKEPAAPVEDGGIGGQGSPASRSTPTGSGGDAVRLTAVERAMQIFLRDPNQSIRGIARQVGCDPALLFRDERFTRLREAYKGKVPKGSKPKDGPLEAEAEE
jgi:hypothetical protein